ncbi:MAG: DUF6152 family protein [Novosphingobium sp.]
MAIVGAGLLAASAPAIAHHSFAMFDQTKLSELRNVTVTRFQWTNPHVYVVVRSGQTTYTLECGSPSNMRETGWKFNTLKTGDTIDVIFFPLRDGKPGGALKLATLAGGKKLKAW